MSSDDTSIRVEGLSKRYEIYSQPADRLKQMILPRVRRWARRPERAYFREFWALRGVDFDVHRGETVGIVGRNGSGKSTLLQLICGTLTPTMGKVEVRGRIAALLELGSGFNPEFTGRENVYLNAAVLGLSREEIDHRFDAIVAFADIGEFVEQPVKTYSSGMYVRLAFAVAINVDPEILVVDEALSVGDEAFQRKCFARIDKIRDAGATILFVSHSAGTVIELCDRAILLDEGELISRGAPKFVVSRYHKLLYAPIATVPLVRERIRDEVLDGCRVHVTDGVDGQRHSDAEAIGSEPDRAYFDVGMRPKSTVHYEQRGALIAHARVTTNDGREVNVLRGGGTYVYSFRVTVSKASAGVRLGMAIKTTTGFALGGATTAPNAGGGITVEAGQVLEAKFEFRALLAPGVYFFNAGVTAVEAEGDVFLDRIIDAVMVRVMPDNNRLATEWVDFDVAPQVEYVAQA